MFCIYFVFKLLKHLNTNVGVKYGMMSNAILVWHYTFAQNV